MFRWRRELSEGGLPSNESMEGQDGEAGCTDGAGSDSGWIMSRAVAASELTAKAYAAEQGLSLHALYQARKRLRALGAVASVRPSGRARKKPVREAVAFSKVELRLLGPVPAEFRLSLPNGVVLEWSGAHCRRRWSIWWSV